MIQAFNNQDSTWSVINSKNKEVATISKVDDSNAPRGFYYRVDYKGEIHKTRIDYFQTARGIANDLIKS